jgi:hypothetical protein
MGICTSSGIIRDFAGSYFVSEDQMAFGDPTKFLQLEISKVVVVCLLGIELSKLLLKNIKVIWYSIYLFKISRIFWWLEHSYFNKYYNIKF